MDITAVAGEIVQRKLIGEIVQRKLIGEIVRSQYRSCTELPQKTRQYRIVVFGVARPLPTADRRIRYWQAGAGE
jgi:hypothetical protein